MTSSNTCQRGAGIVTLARIHPGVPVLSKTQVTLTRGPRRLWSTGPPLLRLHLCLLRAQTVARALAARYRVMATGSD